MGIYSKNVLQRLGSKAKLHNKIIRQFPEHQLYIEPFFGTGAIFFHKRKSKYSYLNDIDKEVFNLFEVLRDEEKKQLLYEIIETLPYHSDVLNGIRENTLIAKNNIEQAAFFLFESNYLYMGGGRNNTLPLKFGRDNTKKHLLNNIKKFNIELLNNTQFNNTDVIKFMNSVGDIKEGTEETFCYCDPPYLLTVNNYNADGWNKENLIELIELLIDKGIKYAISEFKTEKIVEIANKYKLNLVIIGERRTLKSRNTEILMTNYKLNNELFE